MKIPPSIARDTLPCSATTRSTTGQPTLAAPSEQHEATDTGESSHTATTTTSTHTTSTDTAKSTHTTTTCLTDETTTTTLVDPHAPVGPQATLSPQAEEVQQASRIGTRQMAEAIAGNHPDQVEKLLTRAPFLLNRPLRTGETPLQMAARKGREDIVRALLAHKDIEPDKADIQGMTPLHEAAAKGYHRIVMALLNKGARPDVVEQDRRATPLHLAVIGQHTQVVQALLEKLPTGVDARLKSGATPFFLAIDAGHLDTARQLMAHKADINIPLLNKVRPLHMACQKGTPELLSWLLQQTPGLFLIAPNDMNLLHFAAMNIAHGAQNLDLIRQLHPDVFRPLQARPSVWLNLPVSTAIECGQPEDVVNRLTPPGAAPDPVQRLVATTYTRGRLMCGVDLDDTTITELVKIGQRGGIAMEKHGSGGAIFTWHEWSTLNIQRGEFAICHLKTRWDEPLQCVMVETGTSEEVPLVDVARVLHNKGVLRVLFLGDFVVRAAAPIQRRLQYDPSFLLPDNGDFLDLHYVFVGREGTTLTALNTDAATHFLHDCVQGKSHGVPGHSLFDVSAQPLTTLTWDAKEREFLLQRRDAPTLNKANTLNIPTESAQSALLFRYIHDKDHRKLKELLTVYHVRADVTFAGDTALHLACGSGNVRAARLLLDHYADLTRLSKTGQNALDIACSAGHAVIVELLLQRGAVANAVGKQGQTLLNIASALGNGKIVQLLLRHGAPVNPENVEKPSALGQACYNGHLDVANMLLDAGASIDWTGTGGSNTPLMLASAQGHVVVAEWLLVQGAMVNKTNNAASTALHLAARRGHTPVVRLLLDKGAEVDPKNASHQTPLVIAIAEKRSDIAKLLLLHKANAEQTVGETNTSVLHFAIATVAGQNEGVQRQQVAVIELMLQQGASADLPNENGNTPLMVASSLNLHTVVSLLRNFSVQVNHQNHEGDTAIHIACRHGHHLVVKELLQMSPNLAIKNQRHKKASDLAEANGNPQLLQLMRPTARKKWFRL